LKKILIVDDDYPIADAIRMALAPLDAKITICSNGVEAVKALPTVQPDLVILDIMLPGMNGLDVLKTIRSTQSLSQIPVIMITGTNAQVGDQKQQGWSAFVRKPFSLDAFCETVDGLLKTGPQKGPTDKT
jgi:two-component system, OmpR family, response regulator VicR